MMYDLVGPRMHGSAVICPSCRREFKPNVSWGDSSSCSAFFLALFIADEPGMSAYDLSQTSGLAYSATTAGLKRARENNLFRLEQEDRAEGGFRYRYSPLPDHDARIEEFRLRLVGLEARVAEGEKRRAAWADRSAGQDNDYGEGGN